MRRACGIHFTSEKYTYSLRDQNVALIKHDENYDILHRSYTFY